MASKKKPKDSGQEIEKVDVDVGGLEGLSDDVKEDIRQLEADGVVDGKELSETMTATREQFAAEEGAKGQMTLAGGKVRVHVTHDGGTTKTTYKFSGGEGKLSISDAEFKKRCLPKKTKKGKEKKAEISPRVLVARKLRFPAVKHTPQGPEWEEHVNAFEAEVKTVFKSLMK